MLNKQSGLLGLSGLTADMRELLAEEAEHGDRRARLAVDVFCYRVKKYLGAYLAAMNGADAIVFAGGIGENSPDVRARICAGLDWLGISLDPARNAALVGAEGPHRCRGLTRGALGHPDRRGAAHRARYLAGGDGRGADVLTVERPRRRESTAARFGSQRRETDGASTTVCAQPSSTSRNEASACTVPSRTSTA